MGLKLALVGCGAMGSALLKGWLSLKESSSLFETIWVITPHPEKARLLVNDERPIWLTSPGELPESPDILIFAVKPFLLEEVLPLYKNFHSLIVSVAAGKPLSFYDKFFPSSPALRAMPNTPVAVHQGVVGLLGNAYVTPFHKERLQACFEGLGFCLWVDSDEELDKLTAISGSGPAYVFTMIEGLSLAAQSLGFDQKTASKLALSTFLGAATYAASTDESPAILCQHVASTPQGTTAAALAVLEKGGLHPLLKEAVHAAYHRAKELGG